MLFLLVCVRCTTLIVRSNGLGEKTGRVSGDDWVWEEDSRFLFSGWCRVKQYPRPQHSQGPFLFDIQRGRSTATVTATGDDDQLHRLLVFFCSPCFESCNAFEILRYFPESGRRGDLVNILKSMPVTWANTDRVFVMAPPALPCSVLNIIFKFEVT